MPKASCHSNGYDYSKSYDLICFHIKVLSVHPLRFGNQYEDGGGVGRGSGRQLGANCGHHHNFKIMSLQIV